MAIRLAAGVSSYHSAPSLSRTLLTTQEIDTVFVIYGSYHPQYFHFDSLADTRAVCEEYPNTRLVELQASELEKRQRYLDLALNYDFLLIIDDDEFISDGADWGYFRQNCQQIIDQHEQHYIYDIMFDGPIAQSGPRPRLFYQPSKIKYDRKHYWWRLPNGRLADGMSDSCKLIEGIKITHDKSLRLNGDYNLAVLKYQHWLLGHESQYVRTAADLI